MLCSNMPVQVILPREPSASFNGELASSMGAVPKCELLNRLRVYGFTVTVKVLSEPEALVTSAHSTFEWSVVLLVMLAARIMSVLSVYSEDGTCIL